MEKNFIIARNDILSYIVNIKGMFSLPSKQKVLELAQEMPYLEDCALIPIITSGNEQLFKTDPSMYNQIFEKFCENTILSESATSFNLSPIMRAEYAAFWLWLYFYYSDIAYVSTMYELIRYIEKEKLFF